MICPACNKNNAVIDPVFGVLPCETCQDRQSQLKRPGTIPEFVGEDIKQQRKVNHKDIVVDHRKGELNKEWVDIWGKEAARKRGYTEEQIKNAKYVYAGDDSYYGKSNQ